VRQVMRINARLGVGLWLEDVLRVSSNASPTGGVPRGSFDR
jgi:hypothetical protein